MRVVFLSFGMLAACVVSALGVRGTISDRRPVVFLTDMHFQPRYNAQDRSRFFADGRVMRTPPVGTVAFGGCDYQSDAGSPRQQPDFLQADASYYQGKRGDVWVERVPLKVDMALLQRGRERYDIYCAICHGATGNGNGITTQYGLVGVASFHDDLHRIMPDGAFFNVITNGKGRMMPYAAQVSARDRWAIVAYIRALMRSQNATSNDVPEPLRGELDR
jgi:mono/diheme cytochrome c family protein